LSWIKKRKLTARNLKKTGNVRITPRRVRVTIVAVETQ
jgi:hypothetical protein